MVTLAQLRTQARQRADMVYSQNISDAELNVYLNSSACELYDLLVCDYEDYYLTSVNFTLANGDGYTLPSDFYKLRGLDFSSGGNWIALDSFNFNERNRNGNLPYTSTYAGLKYRILGDTLTITPENSCAGDYRLWYIPQLQTLVNDGDSFTTLQRWEEYVVVDACIKMLAKEQDDVSVHMAQKQALIQRIKAAAPNRDAGAGERITDVNYSRDLWEY